MVATVSGLVALVKPHVPALYLLSAHVRVVLTVPGRALLYQVGQTLTRLGLGAPGSGV